MVRFKAEQVKENEGDWLVWDLESDEAMCRFYVDVLSYPEPVARQRAQDEAKRLNREAALNKFYDEAVGTKQPAGWSDNSIDTLKQHIDNLNEQQALWHHWQAETDKAISRLNDLAEFPEQSVPFDVHQIQQSVIRLVDQVAKLEQRCPDSATIPEIIRGQEVLAEKVSALWKNQLLAATELDELEKNINKRNA